MIHKILIQIKAIIIFIFCVAIILALIGGGILIAIFPFYLIMSNDIHLSWDAWLLIIEVIVFVIWYGGYRSR